MSMGTLSTIYNNTDSKQTSPKKTSACMHPIPVDVGHFTILSVITFRLTRHHYVCILLSVL